MPSGIYPGNKGRQKGTLNKPKQDIVHITPIPAQYNFFKSEKRFPCFIGGVGTGKTFFLLNKIMAFCKEYPKARALIVRKEYTDLRDSTIKDFRDNFGLEPDSNKEVTLSNGSCIMFRHGDELNVLKNITLDIVGIEQAEEFIDDQQFIYLRDRLRGKAAFKINEKGKRIYLQQLCVIANACGHNWIWKNWVNNPPSTEYDLVMATTFDNAENLTESFIEDRRALEFEAPAHYQQYVMNSFEAVGSDNQLLEHELVYCSPTLQCPPQGSLARVLGVDVGRYGGDEAVFTILESRNLQFWEMVLQKTRKFNLIKTEDRQYRFPLMEIVGEIIDLRKTYGLDVLGVDDIGVGGGVVDRLREQQYEVVAYNSSEKSTSPMYFNKRSEDHFFMQEMLRKANLKIMPDETLMNQLTSARFGYGSNDERYIWSKERMRKEGYKSPNRSDALVIACSLTKIAFDREDSRRTGNQRPAYGIMDESMAGSYGRMD